MTTTDQLLAIAVNQLRVLAWQNTKDGHKGVNPPEPILLPEQLLENARKEARDFSRAHALKERLAQREAEEDG